jgi:RNA polymerase sigma-70 factor (ECF subfamily)
MQTEGLTQLVERARRGDAAAFEEIIKVWRRRALGIVLRMIGRPDDAEDVAQDAFVRLYLSLDKLRDPAQFEPWMYRLITNAAIDYLRRNRRARIRVSDLSDEQLFTVERNLALNDATEKERRQDLREYAHRMLSVLSAQARALLVLKEIEGLSLKELASLFGLSEDAVKVRLFRARQRIARKALPNGVRAGRAADMQVQLPRPVPVAV